MQRIQIVIQMNYKITQGEIMTLINNKEITAAEIFAGMVEGKTEATSKQASKLISMRIPIVQLAQIDAFAEMINSNRNKVIVHLLDVAAEEVMNEIEDFEVKEKFHKLTGKKLLEFISESSKTIESYDSESPLDVPAKKKKKTVK